VEFGRFCHSKLRNFANCPAEFGKIFCGKLRALPMTTFAAFVSFSRDNTKKSKYHCLQPHFIKPTKNIPISQAYEPGCTTNKLLPISTGLFRKHCMWLWRHCSWPVGRAWLTNQTGMLTRPDYGENENNWMRTRPKISRERERDQEPWEREH